MLKNALDWLVPSGELHEKPVGLITASPDQGGSSRAQRHSLDPLAAQQAVLVQGASVAVPFVRTRFDASGTLTEPEATGILQGSLAAHAAAARAAATAT